MKRETGIKLGIVSVSLAASALIAGYGGSMDTSSDIQASGSSAPSLVLADESGDFKLSNLDGSQVTPPLTSLDASNSEQAFVHTPISQENKQIVAGTNVPLYHLCTPDGVCSCC